MKRSRVLSVFASLGLLSGLLPGLGPIGTGLAQTGTAPATTATPAGTEIRNQAVATFDPLESGGVSSAVSGVILTVVQSICAVSVQPDGTVQAPGQTAAIKSGAGAVFRYTVVNAGNETFEFPLLTRAEPGSAFVPDLRLVLDDRTPVTDAPVVQRLKLAPGERADLRLGVQTTMGMEGRAFVNVIAGCPDGNEGDANNVSQLVVAPPPALTVTKTFEPALIRPGDETTVTVTGRNAGAGESDEVVLSDPLYAQLDQGLVYVPGSARTSAGVLEYTADEQGWSTSEPTLVRNLRVRVPSLKPDDTFTLTFRMRAGEAAENHVIPNVATAVTGSQVVSGSAAVDVRYQPAVAIGPVGQPEVPENTPADVQTRELAVVGQQVCFDHTLKNTGDVRDLFTVTVTYPQGAAQPTLVGADGQPLAQPLPLDPGAEASVRICHTATRTGVLEALITANGARGTSNTTRDRVQGVEAGLPELVKTAVPDATRTLSQGEGIVYTLQVRNPYDRPLNGVTVRDPLPAHVDFVSASENGTVSGAVGEQVVTWNIGTLAAGEARTFTVAVKVSPRALDGEALRNVFSFVATEFGEALPSNEVVNPVWNAALQITKTVSSTSVTPGDRLTYTLRIRNLSATTNVENAVITDTPARGLEYLAGTTILDGKGFADPNISNGAMHWNVGVLPAGGTVEITYQLRVTAEATAELRNTVQVVGDGAGGTVRAIASNIATAVTRLNLLNFAPLSDILGTVFVDRNRNGLYDPQIDTPVERARIILAGGRLALTDKAGRYHFANVPFGTQALRLDPNTMPYLPLGVPQDEGLSGTRTVHVRGLTTVDFPLAPLAGDIAATRQTTLTVGDVRLEKTVQLTPQGYAVTLKVKTPHVLSEVNLNDPLPTGATLQEGRNTLSGSLPSGETTLTYRFVFPGGPDTAVTDPVLLWRN
ncbi:DUF11 domain-containing protein [Deinococcus hopiensis]|uniref:Conserved repeat domain-containing protein/fimbrial isopeptide formation D2 domain-containing protein n=1 Tax=Deinococcus hopiensis KR-140 TaxID=695939 RepID=A0A1W1UX54_9DEIO|nr:DUF11 domain-containing protein [Deinococcus hopiensis]SMB85589.1 conserved repeat domain-containing protein/fimbrial isopeptide formation D2 domain-containing protein [Deinococcus hopiensis KR-140]